MTKKNIKTKKEKLRVGFYDITGCQGCLLSFIYNEDELLDMVNLIDLKSFRFIHKKEEDLELDIAFVEGLVVHNDDLSTLKKIRSNSKIVVALGACAVTGCIPSWRNFSNPNNFIRLKHPKTEKLKDTKPQPIDSAIDIDYYLPGCPPSGEEIKDFLREILLGKKFKNYDKPVCFECRLNGNVCLLEKNKLCLGFITKGGCDAVCPNGGWECWGCRGQSDDINEEIAMKLLRSKGFSDKHVKDRMKAFVGMKWKIGKKKNGSEDKH